VDNSQTLKPDMVERRHERLAIQNHMVVWIPDTDNYAIITGIASDPETYKANHRDAVDVGGGPVSHDKIVFFERKTGYVNWRIAIERFSEADKELIIKAYTKYANDYGRPQTKATVVDPS